MTDLPPIDLPLAPQWSLWVGMLGRGLIVASIVSFVLSLAASFLRPGKLSTGAFVAGCFSLLGSFVTLATLFVADRFEFLYVYQHAQRDNEAYYKIAGIWSGQQGSFLLWACCSAVFGLLALRGTGDYRRWFVATYSAFLGSVAGILAYETPFGLQLIHGKAYVPPDGVGLVPSLQNYWVVIHPPTIFLGFGLLTVLFAYAVAALVSTSYDDWAPRARPWSILSIVLLGLGLCMGGFWAYETLGWGGFWKWDPVENVSFVPWCLTVALTHGLIVQVTRRKWMISNLLLAGLPFLSFVYGTFLTRAGFLDGVSVHSFAQMDRTAHKVLLGFCLTSVIGFASLWTLRAVKSRSAHPKVGWNDREQAYRMGNILLVLMALATAIGTSVPLFQVMSNQPAKVVEEPVYHGVLVWFMVPILVLMAVGPFLAWRKLTLRELAARLTNILSLTLGVVGFTVLAMKHPTYGIQHDPSERVATPFGPVPAFPWITGLFGLCAFVVVANSWRLVELWKRSKPSAGAFLSHCGVAIAMAGLIVSRGLERKQEVLLQEGVPSSALEYFLTFKKLGDQLFDKDNKAEFEVAGRGGEKFVARPGLYYTQQGQEVKPMVWPHIERRFTHDLYFTLHPPSFEAGEPLTLKPGETRDYEVPDFALNRMLKYKIHFDKLDRTGEAGASGTRFVAILRFTDEEGHVTTVAPHMELAEEGVQQPPALLNADYFVRLERMEASDKSIEIQMGFTKPLYPIEFYYKPLTGLVWLGTGILTLGGLTSAFARRRRGSLPASDGETSEGTDPENAPEPTA